MSVSQIKKPSNYNSYDGVAAKYAAYRLLTERLILAFAILILLLWIWDWNFDSGNAMSTVWFRVGSFLLLLALAATMHYRLEATWVGVAMYGVILLVELGFTIILSRLDTGFDSAIGGYLYFVLAIVLLGLPFTFITNVIGSIAVAIAPVLYGDMVADDFPNLRFAISVWPAFATGIFFHWGANRLILDNLQSQAFIETMSLTDPLTGLLNRRALEIAFERARAMIARNGGQVCLLMLDIDHFKRINDTYGHPAGDEVLKTLAGLLGSNLRPTDEKARIGGEEFVCLLPNASLQDAITLGERLRLSVKETAFRIPASGGTVTEHITISLGATYWQSPESLDDAIGRADEAMYEAKGSGRNRLVTRSPQPQADNTPTAPTADTNNLIT